MQRSCIRRAAGEHGAAVEGMLGREQELVAQLRELLLPSPTATPSGDGSSWSSGLVAELFGSIDGCSVKALPGLRGACSHASAMVEAPVSGGRRRRRGTKRARDEEHGELGGGANAKPRCGNKTRRNKEETKALVTTVPDFDGYQWRKYGQKQIECAKYPRSYYRCTNSTDQGCPAKRTVQRNDDDMNGDGGPPMYTVVYIAEHTCKTVGSVAPVILETTVRTTKPAADNNAGAHALVLTPGDVVAPADSTTIGSSSTTTGTESPAISSDITWSSDANSSEQDYCYSHVDWLFAVDDWDPTTPVAAPLLQEIDFTGPIRSPVHIAADGWIDELLVNEPINIPSSCHLFGF